MPPLVRPLAVALLAGAAAALLLPGRAADLLLLAIVAGTGCVLIVPRAEGRRIRAASVGLALLGGLARGSDTPPDGPAPPEERVLVVAEVEALTPARLSKPPPTGDPHDTADAWFSARLPGPERVAVLVHVTLSPGETAPRVLPGDRFRVIGRAEPARTRSNPGEREPRDAPPGVVLRAGGGSALARLPGVRAAALPARAAAALRSTLLERLGAACGAGPGGGLLGCLLLGERSGLDEGDAMAFRRAGAAHVLAVSGLHVVLLIGSAVALWCAVVPAAVRGAVDVWAFTLATGIYCAACGFATPVVRATIFLLVAATARRAGRRSRTLDHLSVAALLVVSVDPRQVLDTGFHLSFLAVAGLALLTRRFREALFPDLAVLERFPEALPPWRLRTLTMFANSVSASFAAFAATAPVVAAAFGQLQPVGPLTNLAAVPMVAALLPAASVLCLLGGVAPAVTGPTAEALALPLRALVDALARLPGAWLSTGPPAPVWLVVSLVALTAACAVRRWDRRHLLLPLACWAALAAGAFRDTHPTRPEVVTLDVGHGMAVLVRSPHGGALLYDAGGHGRAVEDRVVVPALLSLGVRRLGAVFVSHEDADHCAGVPRVVETFCVGRVVVPPDFGRTPSGRAVLRACEEQGVPVVRTGRGERFEWPGIDALVLGPAPCVGRRSRNGDSIVLHVRVRGHAEELTALLPGDVEDGALDDLAADPTVPAADALLLPHHGLGAPGPHLALARRVGARTLVASHGDADVVEVPGAAVTGRDGALRVLPGGIVEPAR